ncbi:SDR family NAD(P)-dependent oxidoreductase [bacterium]|nr:SDR family NAD(P)-dependent oxidoreductase [bacterium]
MIQNWIIAGATGGLGSAIARELADHGCSLSVLATEKSREVLEQNARDLGIRSGEEVKTKVFDALKTDDWSALIDEMRPNPKEPFGVIWAAGVLSPQKDLQNDLTRAQHDHQLNYVAAMQFLEAAVAQMKPLDEGHVVALGSPAGDRGRRSNYFYGASKAALHTYIEGLQHRLATSAIRVTLVKPGPTRTRMTAGIQKPLMSDPKQQAKRIVQAIRDGKPLIYTPPIWWPVMCIVRHLPRFIFYRLDF